MTINKLPSGNYRVREMKNGKTYSITFDHKPTKREAEEAIRSKMIHAGERPNGTMTFAEAADAYVAMKENVLSPNTVREYIYTKTRLSPWFASMQIDDIDQIAINKQVNEWAAQVSPKTVRNYHGFLSAILGTFRPSMKIYTTLPQKRKIEPYIPSDEDVKKLLAELKDTEYYIPVVLACYGMRRGEILALKPEDIDGNTVHIRHAMAFDLDNKPVIKSTKTTESERDIFIPMEIADLIREKGYVYRGHANAITCRMAELQDKLGIPHFSIHKLRHYFASKMLTITDSKTVQVLGGWKTDTVMKTIYAHSMKAEQDKAKKAAIDALSKSIF